MIYDLKELFHICRDELENDDYVAACIKASDNFQNYDLYKQFIDVLNECCGADLDYTVYYTGNRIFKQIPIEKVRVVDGVTEIGRYAFYYCESLQSITIPACVTEVGEAAFESCESLQSINIPSRVTKIGQRTFCSCESLQSITIPNRATKIGNYAFTECESLQSIALPKRFSNDLERIGINSNKTKVKFI